MWLSSDRIDHRLVDLRLLGAVSAAPPDGGPVVTGKAAELLARLATGNGNPFSRQRLLDDVWPHGSGHPGPLRVAVSRARAALGHGVIVTVGGSYRIGPHTSDVRRIEHHLAAARDTALPPARRIAAYDLGLAEWSGPFLDGIDGRVWVLTERVRLVELREVVIDERFEVLLAAGEHKQVLSELRAAALAAPTREHRAWLLALAFYRCGRQADALTTINVWARRLRRDFGLEPGPELRDLEQRILRHDSSLDGRLVATSPAGPGRCRRRDQPATADKVDCTDERLTGRRQRRPS